MIQFKYTTLFSTLLTTLAISTTLVYSQPSLTPEGSPAPSPLPTPSAGPEAKTDSAEPDPSLDVIYSSGDSIEIAHPYEPKALGIIPQGWIPKAIPDYTVRNPNVALKDGTTVSIECPIHQLTPDSAAGYHPFHEPGFDPQKGTTQTATLGAILTRSIATQNQLSQQTGDVLAQLEMTINKELYTSDTTQEQKNLLIDRPSPTPATPVATASTDTQRRSVTSKPHTKPSDVPTSEQRRQLFATKQAMEQAKLKRTKETIDQHIATTTGPEKEQWKYKLAKWQADKAAADARQAAEKSELK